MSDASNTSDPRYAIGIDLGTTHSALSYVDLQASDGEKVVDAVLPIPQLTAPGTIEALPLLPSFLYLPHPDELPAGERALPWSGCLRSTKHRSRSKWKCTATRPSNKPSWRAWD